MNDLQIFEFENKNIRTVVKDNQLWFVGKDVADVLGYSNTRDALQKHVDVEDKDVANRDTLGGSQNLAVINESGLYSLILKSQLTGAKQFKRWVTNEVLPSIRKQGAYLTEDIIAKTLKDPNYILRIIQAFSDAKQELSIKNQIIGELKPRVDYLDLILKGKELVTISQIAKDYGMSAKKFNVELHNHRIQYLVNGQWLLYADYQSKGYTSSISVVITRTDGRREVKMNTQWTQKGRMFLYNILKEKGLLPMIERENL